MTNLFTTVEGSQTDATVSLASGSRQLERAVFALPVTRDLMAEGARHPGVPAAIVDRVRFLAGQRTDPRYANPVDVALTVYLLVLSRLSPDDALTAAAVAREVPKCFWAPLVAEAILASPVRTRVHRVWFVKTAIRSDADHGDSDTSVRSSPRQLPDPGHGWEPSVVASHTQVVGLGSAWTLAGSGASVSRTFAA